MRLLIIEDDKALAELINKGLQDFGFQSDIANTLEVGEEKSYINNYDAILLDLNLPDGDGLNFLNEIRKQGILTPVIIVTARNEINERAMGLDLGADDYIVKPFDFIEMRARIQAVVRRFYSRSSIEIKIGNLIINPGTRVTTYKDKEIHLSTKEFDILEYIGNKYPDIVSSEDIAEHVYDEDFNPFSSVLRVHMSNLKKKLRNVAGEEILKTIKGKGYKLWKID